MRNLYQLLLITGMRHENGEVRVMKLYFRNEVVSQPFSTKYYFDQM